MKKEIKALYKEVFIDSLFDRMEGERYPCRWDKDIVILDKNLNVDKSTKGSIK